MQQHCTTRRYLSYFEDVAAITVSKKDSLILNVDGAVAASMLDWMVTFMSLSEIRALVTSGLLNGVHDWSPSGPATARTEPVPSRDGGCLL